MELVGTEWKQPPVLEQRVSRFIEQHHLVLPHQRLVVAVSGGPDSVCLLHILSRLKEELGIRLHVAHLNHQLRGSEADADACYVSELSRHLDIPATVERRDVAAYRARQHLSLEEAAREVRYDFLAEVASSVGAGRVAVGHTIDDHIETILMHLIRGAGTRGLRGLEPLAELRSISGGITIVRPLLRVSHEETGSYCSRLQLAPRDDTSNLSPSPLRNRIRHQLLPLLREYNPRIGEALLRTARIASDDISFLDEQVAQVWDEVTDHREDTIILDKERFCRLPSALQRYLLRSAVEKLVSDVKDVEMRHIDEIMAALTKPAGRRLDLPFGLTFSIDYSRFLISQTPAALCPFPVLNEEWPLNVPGETRLPGWHIWAAIMTPQGAKGGTSSYNSAGQSYSSCFDFDRTGHILLVRGRRPGDRFQPLGMGQLKKVNEFMIDAKVPRLWRQRIPIVVSPEQILWVAGWRIDDRVKVTAATKRILCLKFERV